MWLEPKRTWTQNTHIFKQVELFPWHTGEGVADLLLLHVALDLVFIDCTNDQNNLFAPNTGKYALASHGTAIYPLLQQAVPTTITESVINQSLLNLAYIRLELTVLVGDS